MSDSKIKPRYQLKIAGLWIDTSKAAYNIAKQQYEDYLKSLNSLPYYTNLFEVKDD